MKNELLETREKWLSGQKEKVKGSTSTEKTIAISVGATLVTVALVIIGIKLFFASQPHWSAAIHATL